MYEASHLHFSLPFPAFLLHPTSLWADPPYIVKVQHYSLEQGLPYRAVLSIEQDRQGFIWIRIFNNAYRFDGYTFKALPQEKQPKPGQLAKIVRAIRPEAQG